MDLAILYQGHTEPVTLQEAKDFLAVDHDEHDSLISSLITAARQRAENYCNQSFVEKRYVLALDNYPRKGTIKLPRGPVRSIISVKYNNGTEEVTLSSNKYHLNNYASPAWILFKEPFTPADEPNSLKIQYITGFDSVSYIADGNEEPAFPFPEPVRTAIKMITRTMYDHRDDLVVGAAVNQIPKSSEYLLNDYRVFEFL